MLLYPFPASKLTRLLILLSVLVQDLEHERGEWEKAQQELADKDPKSKKDKKKKKDSKE